MYIDFYRVSTNNGTIEGVLGISLYEWDSGTLYSTNFISIAFMLHTMESINVHIGLKCGIEVTTFASKGFKEKVNR